MKRRTYRNLKGRVAAQDRPEHHHSVYVVLLDDKAASLGKVVRANPNRNPAKPCLYVGMTGLTPEQRFQNHKRGFKAARVVQRYGKRLLPEFYACFNPMPYEAAAQMEKDLSADLRAQGYTVVSG